MNILRAEDILRNYPNPKGTRLADIYDEDDQLRAAVNTLFPGFEYPDYSHKSLSELWNQYEKKKLPIASGDSVFVHFPGGVMLRQVILGNLQEQLYSILGVNHEDLLIEYCSPFEVEALRKRLGGQVPMSVLTREQAQALAETGETA